MAYTAENKSLPPAGPDGFSPNRDRTSRDCSFAAIIVLLLVLLGYLVILHYWKPAPIADERLHLRAIDEQLTSGGWTWPAYLPMPPVYHAIVAIPARMFGASLFLVRAINTLISCVLLLILWRIAKRLGSSSNLALCFVQPFLFPFLPLAYTEAASTTLIIAALWACVARRQFSCAILVAGATCFRQSNLMIAPILLLFGWFDVSRESRPFTEKIAAFAKQHGALMLVTAGALITFASFPGLLPLDVEANRPRFNPAQFWLLGLCVIVWWLPILVLHVRPMARNAAVFARRSPLPTGTMLIVGLLTVFALTSTYSNPHPWNHNTMFLRNLPLIALEGNMTARTALAALIVMTVPLLGTYLWHQPRKAQIITVLVVTGLYLAPQSLAEPRYYAIPFLLLALLMSPTDLERRLMQAWSTILTLAVCGYTLIAGRAMGGTL